MILARAAEAEAFVELRFKPGMWKSHGIPEAGCRLRIKTMTAIIADGGAYQVEQLMLGLMDWLDVTENPEPTLRLLRRMLDRHYPDDGQDQVRCHFAPEKGSDYIFDVARKIVCDRPVVAWQRRHWVIALGAASKEPGRMVVGALGPVSLRVAKSIFGHSQTTFMLEPFDSFAAARATSRTKGSFLSWEAGQATLIDWDYGLGRTVRDNKLVADDQLKTPGTTGWLPPRQLAIQVAIAEGYFTDGG